MARVADAAQINLRFRDSAGEFSNFDLGICASNPQR
jgi:hypothetical protein